MAGWGEHPHGCSQKKDGLKTVNGDLGLPILSCKATKEGENSTEWNSLKHKSPFR